MAAEKAMRVVIWTVVGLAALVRLSRWALPDAAILGGGEYDPGVMYIASAMLLDGQLPYRDYVFLHPPGILLGLAPTVLVGGVFGDAAGLAAARLGTVLIGVINTGLAALLLRPYGVWAVALGAGSYAGWSALAYTEQQPLLEPFLVTALFVGLLLIRKSRLSNSALAGFVLGVATMVKVWSVIDLVVLGLVVICSGGGRRFGAYVMGAGFGGSLIALYFFASAPSAMWEMVVQAQLGRANDAVSLLARAGMFGPVPGLRHWVYQGGMALALLILLATAVFLMARGLRLRGDVRAKESALWGGLVVVHALAMVWSASFYDHYAMFVAAPMTLVLGAFASLVHERFRHRRVLSVGIVVIVAIMATVSVSGSVARALNAGHITAKERDYLVQWSNTLECTWSSVSDRVLRDDVVDALERGCPMTADPYGVSLLAQSRGVADWRAQRVAVEAAQLEVVDGLILPASGPWPFHKEQEEQFELVTVLGDRAIWERRG